MVSEGVEDLHGQRSLPQRFVAVQEPYQHRQEYFTLCDLYAVYVCTCMCVCACVYVCMYMYMCPSQPTIYNSQLKHVCACVYVYV